MTDSEVRAHDLINWAAIAVSGFMFFALAASPFFH